MPTPEFILSLREKIGHEQLWLSGISAVVQRADGDILLVRRADSGRWTCVAGIIDPGEEPADAAEREVLEEAGIVAVAERLAWVHVLPPTQWENGDRAQFLDLVFQCRHLSGDPGAGRRGEHRRPMVPTGSTSRRPAGITPSPDRDRPGRRPGDQVRASRTGVGGVGQELSARRQRPAAAAIRVSSSGSYGVPSGYSSPW